MAALTPGPYFELEFKPILNPVAFTASGLDLGSVTVSYLTAISGTLQQVYFRKRNTSKVGLPLRSAMVATGSSA